MYSLQKSQQTFSAEMRHEILINAPAEKVYEALTEASGLSSWWTADVEAQAVEGSIATFGFGGRATVFRMRIELLDPNRKVVWLCLGDADEWEGTVLEFDLEQSNAKQCIVHFNHSNWHSTKGWYAMCNTTWGALMVRLKDYLEGNCGEPFFDGLPQKI